VTNDIGNNRLTSVSRRWSGMYFITRVRPSKVGITIMTITYARLGDSKLPVKKGEGSRMDVAHIRLQTVSCEVEMRYTDAIHFANRAEMVVKQVIQGTDELEGPNTSAE